MIKKISYIKYLVFHPFDGFYDLKHEKRGSGAVAALILASLILVSILQKQLDGFTYNLHDPEDLNVFAEIAGVLVPYGLFCIANWAVTTLMDGEGGLKDIFIYTAYALSPAVFLGVVFLICSNIFSLDEVAFLQFINVLSTLWVAFLMFVGTLTTHQYSGTKTFVAFLIILFCIILMLFTFTLFFTLIDRVIEFINTIVMELSLR